MEQQLANLFPDEVVKLQEYRSFVNQPERIQITSFDDINDYDPIRLTSYYNFRVRLPRPALNVKTLQLARANIPNCVPSFPDTECVFWYYALPYEAEGTIYLNNGGVPGAQAYTFDKNGNVYDNGVLQDPTEYQVYFGGNGGGPYARVLINGTLYIYSAVDAVSNPPTPVIEPTDPPPPPTYFLEYDAGGSVSTTLRPQYLCYVRLLPSFVQPELYPVNSFGYNRTFTDYDDLVAELNNSTTDDPLNGVNLPIDEFHFVPNQIAFSYDQRFNKIVFTGLDPYRSYCPAASDDPNLLIASQLLAERDTQNVYNNILGAIQLIQPFQPYRYLNQRLGFNYATYTTNENFTNMIRPKPPYEIQQIGDVNTYDHMAPGYADLVYSSCCHIYCDVTGGSSVDSLVNKALLASIPINTPSLGVGFHSLPLNNPLTKIVNQIYEISIELRTDTGQPFYLGNNAIVSLEFILTY